MNYNLIQFLFIPIAAFFISTGSGLMEKFKFWWYYRKYTHKTPYKPYRLKPLDCEICLSFHMSWIYSITAGQHNWFEVILIACAASTLAYIITRLIDKL